MGNNIENDGSDNNGSDDDVDDDVDVDVDDDDDDDDIVNDNWTNGPQEHDDDIIHDNNHNVSSNISAQSLSSSQHNVIINSHDDDDMDVIVDHDDFNDAGDDDHVVEGDELPNEVKFEGI